MADVLFVLRAHTRTCTLSLHDALPISNRAVCASHWPWGIRGCRVSCCWPCSPMMPTTWPNPVCAAGTVTGSNVWKRSEEHTSELQSRGHLVCRLLLAKKKHKESEFSTV